MSVPNIKHLNTKLIQASFDGDLDQVKFLVENGADIQANNNEAIINASANGQLEVVKYLVENGVDIQTEKNEPIKYASQYGQLDVVKYLVENGADFQADNNYPIRLAYSKGKTDLVEYLLSQGAVLPPNYVPIPVVQPENPNKTQQQLKDELLQASETGNLDKIKYLVSLGADIKTFHIPIKLATQLGKLEIVKYLVENGADVQADNNFSIIFASRNGHLDVVKYLVDHGANIQAQNNKAIQLASENGHLKVVEYLLSKGAVLPSNVYETKQKELNLKLINASYDGNLDQVKFLVENGANIHADNDYAIINASKKGNLEVIKFLVENGANVQANNNEAIIYASYIGHLDTVKYLVENGANVQTNNNYPIIMASKNGHLDVVKYLVENGANVQANNNEPIKVASQNGHTKVVNYLQWQGAVLPPKQVPSVPVNIKQQAQLPTSEIYNVYDILSLPKPTPNPNNLIINNNTITYIGLKYSDTINNAKNIGTGWNGIVACCSVINNVDVTIKYPKILNNVLPLQIEFIVYEQLRNYFDFPVIPIIDRGSNYEFILKPFLAAEYFGDKIGSNLSDVQLENLKDLWFRANKYAIITGIPLDLKPDNIWWDTEKLQWFLVDTGPRLDAGDNYKYAYTLDPETSEQFIDTYFIQKKNEGSIKPLVKMNIYTSEIFVNYMKYTKNQLTKLTKANMEQHVENMLKSAINSGDKPTIEMALKAITPTKNNLKFIRTNIYASKLLCKIHKICPKSPESYTSFVKEIDTIGILRTDTAAFHKTLSLDEKAAFTKYTGSGYTSLNNCLRYNKNLDACSETDRVNILLLENILNKDNTPRLKGPISVYRGIHPSGGNKVETDRKTEFIRSLKELTIGDLWEDRAFISTSVQYPTGFIGDPCCLMIFNLPANMPAYYIGSDSSVSSEEEVILQPGTVFQLIDIKYKNQMYKSDTYYFNCVTCVTGNRYILSKSPDQFNLYTDIKSRPYQPTDRFVGKNRLSITELYKYNQYIPSNYAGTIRIMTWNVHEWRNAKNIDKSKQIQSIISDINPDVVGLQEVSVNNYLPGQVCKADQGTYGLLHNMIYSRHSQKEYTNIDLGPNNRCAIRIKVTFGTWNSNKTLYVYNVHLEVKSETSRLENISRIFKDIETLPSKNIIIMGDFNSYKRDDYSEENYKLLENIKKPYIGMDIFRVTEELEKNGFIDVYEVRARALNISHKDIIPLNTTDKGGRIDFIYINQESEFKVDNVYTYYTDVSDHIPIIVDLKY